jgi:stage V sporulation protein B
MAECHHTDGEKTARFVSGGAALLAASLTSGVLSFVWTVMMSRLLGPEGFGITGPFLNAFWMLTMALSFGVPYAMATFISDCNHVNPAEAKRIMARGTRLMILIGAGFCAVAAAGATAARLLGGAGQLYVALAWVMIAALSGRQAYMAMYAVLGGVQRMDVLAVCNASYPVTMLAGSIIFVLLARKYYPGDLNAGIIAGTGGIACGAICQYAVSLVAVRFAGVTLKELFAWRAAGDGSKKLLSFGLLAAVVMIAGSSLTCIPPVIVSFLAHSFGLFGAGAEANAVNAGWFSSGFTNALAPMLIVGMVYAIVPAVSEAQAQGNRPLMQRYYDLAVKYCLAITLYVLCVYAVYAGRIVELFSGHRFPKEAMGPLTTLLAAGVSASMFVMLICNIMIGLKRPGAPAGVAVAALAVEIAALAAAGLAHGTIYTAAVCFDAVIFTALVFLVYYLSKSEGLKWPWGAMPRPAAAAAVTAVLAHFLPAEGKKFIFGVAASFPCYLALLAATGGLKRDDIKLLFGKKDSSR